MKQGVAIGIKDKEYNICFNIRTLLNVEREIDKSITSLFTLGVQGLIAQTDINFTIAGIKNGIKDLDTEAKAIEFIEAYCGDGHNLDELNGHILNAITATGLFNKNKANQEGEDKEEGKQ